MHSLEDGSPIRTLNDDDHGRRHLKFNIGGLCVSPDGDSVLVAESYNDRVQEVRIADGVRVRFIGAGELREPQCVDCNADVIAVSENSCSVCVLAWVGGGLLARFGSWGSGISQLQNPRGVRLLAERRGVVVADYANNRLCVFDLTGGHVKTIGGAASTPSPWDVVECTSTRSFIVADYKHDKLVNVGWDGQRVAADVTARSPSALAVLPDGALVVRQCTSKCVEVFRKK